MVRDIPSLNAIRFFECAARHLSFTRAGEELFVTQNAVSRQVKLLEEQLGAELFVRSGPNLKLTVHGKAFQKTVADALDIIRQGTGSLRRGNISTLTVSVLPSFASNWLIPRIPNLEAYDSTLSLMLESSYVNIDFNIRTDIDVAIRLGRGTWPGLYSRQITRDRMFPVCTPALAAEIRQPPDPGGQDPAFS
ncbi:MAG: LysR family transcriptional regulator [Pseudohongiellaceae bacterium]